MKKKHLINNRIRAPKVRLIGPDGEQAGVVPLKEALQRAKERNLDLVQVAEKAKPPVCKIMDYGKYLYRLQKKEQKGKKSTEVKGIRLRYNISPHDMETRARQAEKFLKEGNKIKVEMVLRGREHRLKDFAKDKIKDFLSDLNERVPIKIEGKIQKKGRGFSIIVTRAS